MADDGAFSSDLRREVRDIDTRLIGVEKRLEADSEFRHEVYENLRAAIASMNARVNAVLVLFISTIVATGLAYYVQVQEQASIKQQVIRLNENVVQNNRRLEDRLERAEETAEEAKGK